MKRAYRLRRPEHFRRVRREGRTYTSPHLTLQVAAGRRKRTRCGFVVSKQFGAAVRRNRARRRVREAVRLALPSIVPGYDLVFVVRGVSVLTMPFSSLQREVEHLLRRACLWSDTAGADTIVDALAAEHVPSGKGVNPDPVP
ncbi:MAG: ribonuclease P protein component [Oscillochloridaceae bacterium]|nr:ribonuclease P protein component [Oscillochloridaceae bacterium]